MKRFPLPALVLSLICALPLSAFGGGDYPDHDLLTARLKKLASDYPHYVSLESLTQTSGGRDIWLLSLGAGNLADRPAVAVVGGTEGDHLLGTGLALRFAEMLLEESSGEETRRLLENHTFYVFPDMTPDAGAQYFAPLKYERKGNDNSSYTDRYGNEIGHPYRDLNGDGMITLMRVKDPHGDWLPHPDDKRVMVRADKSSGELGEYSLYAEGVDLLKSERWTEAGVNFNMNFSFKFPVFTSGAGDHAVSEKESRAIASFLFEAKNVYAVVSFGPANNLAAPLRYNERDASGRIITGILEGDARINQMVSRKYVDMTGDISGPAVAGSDGDFFQWAYFHYGRHSFSTPGWSFPREASGNESRRSGDERDDCPALLFLRWADEQGMDDVFIPWESVVHPEFPDKEIEVGGISPFAMTNPPREMAEEIARSHYRFIVELAGLRPEIEIRNIKKEELGRGVYRITADVANTGRLPTVTELGERVRWVQKTVIRLETDRGQEALSGNRIEVLGAIEGGKAETRSWLIRGRGTVKIRAGAENTGFDEVTVRL